MRSDRSSPSNPLHFEDSTNTKKKEIGKGDGGGGWGSWRRRRTYVSDILVIAVFDTL